MGGFMKKVTCSSLTTETPLHIYLLQLGSCYTGRGQGKKNAMSTTKKSISQLIQNKTYSSFFLNVKKKTKKKVCNGGLQEKRNKPSRPELIRQRARFITFKFVKKKSDRIVKTELYVHFLKHVDIHTHTHIRHSTSTATRVIQVDDDQAIQERNDGADIHDDGLCVYPAKKEK